MCFLEKLADGLSYGHNRVLGGNIRLRRSHSNSIGNKREKDTAGCRALDRKYIVIGGALETEQEGDRYLPDSEQPDPTLPGLQAEPTAEADADNWLNEADTSWYDSGEKNFEIDTAAELAEIEAGILDAIFAA